MMRPPNRRVYRPDSPTAAAGETTSDPTQSTSTSDATDTGGTTSPTSADPKPPAGANNSGRDPPTITDGNSSTTVSADGTTATSTGPSITVSPTAPAADPTAPVVVLTSDSSPTSTTTSTSVGALPFTPISSTDGQTTLESGSDPTVEVSAPSPTSTGGAADAVAGTGTTPSTPTLSGDSGGLTSSSSGDSSSIPSGISLPPPDPLSVPGAGRGPPAPWTVDSNGQPVSVVVDGADLVVTVNGVSTSRASADVTTLIISGGGAFTASSDAAATWTWDGGTGTISGDGFSISFSGVFALNALGPDDTLVGPAADSTWNVTGAGAGTVGGLAFSGFENLSGAADNRDTFVIAGTGSVSGVVQGGDGGYDTVSLGPGTYTSLVSTITGPQSGTLARDGDLIAYEGMEPINVAGCPNCTVTLTAGATVTLHAGANDNQIVVDVTGGESQVFDNVDTIASLTINGTNADDTFTIQALGPNFNANLTIFAGVGLGTDIFNLQTKTGNGVWRLVGNGATETLVGPDADTQWIVNAAGAGTTGAGPTLVSFEQMTDLTGNAHDDTFTLNAPQPIIGTIDGGNGNDTIVASNDLNFWVEGPGPNRGQLNGHPFRSIENEAARLFIVDLQDLLEERTAFVIR